MAGCHVKPEQMFNLIFGYNDRYAEAPSVAGNGGTVYANGTAVPAGEVWVVTSLCSYHSDPTARKMMLVVDCGGTDEVIHWSGTMAQWASLDRQGWWVLKEGDYIQARFDGIIGGATGYVFILGFKMKLTQ